MLGSFLKPSLFNICHLMLRMRRCFASSSNMQLEQLRPRVGDNDCNDEDTDVEGESWAKDEAVNESLLSG